MYKTSKSKGSCSLDLDEAFHFYERVSVLRPSLPPIYKYSYYYQGAVGPLLINGVAPTITS